MLRLLILSLLLSTLTGAANVAETAHFATGFQFARDTFAYTNQLTWVYEVDPVAGTTTAHAIVPKPPYTLRCVVLARTARQFFEHARFEPNEPRTCRAGYRQLVRMVIATNPSAAASSEDRIVIPGYTSLREFSADYEDLLKAEAGGAWRSFVQRGNWRMIFPFSRRHQEGAARRLLEDIAQGRPPLVHLVDFPAQAINHTILLGEARESSGTIEFEAYDPNRNSAPVHLTYNRATRSFRFPPTHYFAGGPVNVYEIYRGWLY
jgi:hypothetical protein